MTRASNRSASSLSLGSPEAAPNQHIDLPPEIVIPSPPAQHADAPVQAENQPAASQPASGPAPVSVPSAPVPSTAQNLTTQLLSMDPTMSVDQLTGILNILAPNRHMRSVASNLLRSSQPATPQPAPATGVNLLGPAQQHSHPPPTPRVLCPQPRPLN